ncbi:MAG: cupredoxin domain-containing protein [Chloroflexi bacterium]|nr:cupredoxin domain-containing protein [Chloroflexota bacterium]MDA1240664.1 cupredoxin domain-containing protein [Chloroflexota bacterium]
MTARCLALLLATFAAVALLACTSTPAASPEGGDPALFAIEPDLRVEIAMHDIRFEPSTFEVDRGALVAIALENAGEILHDFTLERTDIAHGYRIEGEAAHHHAEGGGPHVALRAGQRGELRMRFDEPGEYVFYCDVTGHRRGGMTGIITVR